MAEDRDPIRVSGEALEALRHLALDDRRLTEDERTMLALALAELDRRRELSGSDERL